MTWLSHFQKEKVAPKSFSCTSCRLPWRCCDFTPFVPNFLVGFSLQKLELCALLENLPGERLHPLGLLPPMEKSPGRVCDFFDPMTKRCRNWEHRPSECSSYFCEEELVRQNPRLKKEPYDRQSQIFFEFEFQLCQVGLRASGFSPNQISLWTSQWNEWVIRSTPLSDFSWDLGLRDRMEIYKNLWDWVCSHSWEELLSQVEEPVQNQVKNQVKIHIGSLSNSW